MASASAVLRGQLRPGIGRSPPFLVIALLIVISILAFNYWSLSDRYNTLEEQMTDIQDHLRLMTIKKENAEKQLEAFDSKLKDSEDVIRKQKTLVDEKESERKDLVWQLDSQKGSASKLQEKLNDLNSVVEKQSVSLKDFRNMEKKLETLRGKNSELSVRNEQSNIQVRDLQRELSAAKRQFYIPPIQLPSGSKTGANEARGNDSKASRDQTVAVKTTADRSIFNEKLREQEKEPVLFVAKNDTKDSEGIEENFGPPEMLDESSVSTANNDTSTAAERPKEAESPSAKSQVPYVIDKINTSPLTTRAVIGPF